MRCVGVMCPVLETAMLSKFQACLDLTLHFWLEAWVRLLERGLHSGQPGVRSRRQHGLAGVAQPCEWITQEEMRVVSGRSMQGDM